MEGILIVAHGSRARETEVTLEKIIDIVKEKLKDCLIEYGFMEFSDKNISKGLNSLMEKGVNKIKVVPYFLFDGIHIKEDIPNEINEIMKNHKDVKVTFTKTLGTDERLADILIDNINFN